MKARKYGIRTRGRFPPSPLAMVFLFLCSLLLFSCEKAVVPAAVNETPRTMRVSQDDEEILQIAEDARNTLPVFFRHVIRPGAEEKHFSVKYPFRANDNGSMEQVWLSGIHFKNGIYYGVLASSPEQIEGMKKGDTVVFEADNITDWMYVRGNKIIGGYSIKYLLEKIPGDQRSDGEEKLLQMFY